MREAERMLLVLSVFLPLPGNACVLLGCRANQDQRRASDALKVELQLDVCSDMGAEIGIPVLW